LPAGQPPLILHALEIPGKYVVDVRRITLTLLDLHHHQHAANGRPQKARETAVRLREIKTAHGLPSDFELKWTKVSPAKLGFYMEVLNYFFDDDDLHFRAWVAHKAGLRHADFGQTHADWYYKMMFGLVDFDDVRGNDWLAVNQFMMIDGQHNIVTRIADVIALLPTLTSFAPGKITLPAGQSPLILRTLYIPGKCVMDVRRIALTLLD
jgi:hypothetical protein